MKPIKLVGALAAIFFASAVLSSCGASAGTVTYQGSVKGLPVTIVVG
jgi:uncharacterized lipoprotein YehR (DUF1307 family)